MLFSVVIPLYNKADTIERAIRSVWAQSFKVYELIVVNDGSTDGSLSIVQRLAQERAFKIVDKPNGGVSSARNAGAYVASGQYIALLDGDDVWYPNHLSLIAKAISKHPNIGFFGSGYERITKDYVYFTIPWGRTLVTDVFSAYKYAQPIHTSTAVIKKQLWHKIKGFNTVFSIYEDYEFFFRLGLHTKLCIVRRISAKYTSDAIYQVTQNSVKLSRNTRPHYILLERIIKEHRASRTIMEYVKVTIRLVFAMDRLRVYDGVVGEFSKLFPGLFKVEEKNRLLTFWLGAFLFYNYYRLRNHLVIWRKKRT